MTNDNVISVLNNLIETCKDGQEGFQKASENVKDSSLKTLCYDASLQRAQFAGELQEQVRTLGGDPEKSGSLAGSIHRGWIDLKGAITAQDDAAILSECERGEDSAVSNYKDAMENELPANISEIVNRQYASVKQTHDRIRSMRDQAKAAKR